MHKDIGIARTPPDFLPFILDSPTKRVRPAVLVSERPRSLRLDLPLDSTLLPASLTIHECTDPGPKDVVIPILVLFDGQVGHNFNEL